jgi:hypothetical protein
MAKIVLSGSGQAAGGEEPLMRTKESGEIRPRSWQGIMPCKKKLGTPLSPRTRDIVE